MKKSEYFEIYAPDPAERQQELDAEKREEYDLPEFTKEIPISSKRTEAGGTVTMEYEWEGQSSPGIKICSVSFREGEDLSELCKIAARDGMDSVSFTYRNRTYILRKTILEIAKAVYNTYSRIRGEIENVVGYLRTLFGNEYLISARSGRGRVPVTEDEVRNGGTVRAALP